MAKAIKSDTVRIEVSEVRRLTRMAQTSRVAVVRAAQDYRRAHESVLACRANARAHGLDPAKLCNDAAEAAGAAQDRLQVAALAVAMDDE